MLSAYTCLKEIFNYNSTPLAPLVTKVIAHSKLAVRRTWAPNGEEGWHVGPVLEHYRWVLVYFPRTRSVRPVDTVQFFPTF